MQTEKRFHTESFRGRPINIFIDTESDIISFRFALERNREFYWIGVSDWVENVDHWSQHLNRKSWFTTDMENFINSNLNLKKMKNFVDWYIQDYEKCADIEQEGFCQKRIESHINKGKYTMLHTLKYNKN